MQLTQLMQLTELMQLLELTQLTQLRSPELTLITAAHAEALRLPTWRRPDCRRRC